ncbi:hypothetical protein GCM10010345_90760 [Streptomyces canarius]|uniref:Uncharacterized protein n=1 Tax=Streptomyces canarius TaxID=285453 RepID=A0ABQ3DCD3_9ACTN|nr:hypothetical protein GCM10010345_90760 [Streptomyces canarius]
MKSPRCPGPCEGAAGQRRGVRWSTKPRPPKARLTGAAIHIDAGLHGQWSSSANLDTVKACRELGTVRSWPGPSGLRCHRYQQAQVRWGAVFVRAAMGALTR